MLISDSRGFLFIHIPRTAGSSVEEALKPFGRSLRPKHITAEQIAAEIRIDRYHAMHTFTVVREPMARIVSYYSHLMTKYPHLKSPRHRKPIGESWTCMDDFIETLEGKDAAWRGVRWRARPQVKFISIKDRLAVDSFLRFERLPGDFNALCDTLGLQTIALPHVNKSKPQEVEVSRRVRDFVHENYAEDYRVFGYEMS